MDNTKQLCDRHYNLWEAKQLRQTFRNIGINPDYIDTRSIQPLVREWRVNVIGGCGRKAQAIIKNMPGFIKMTEYGKPGHSAPWCYYGQHYWFKKGKIKKADSKKQSVFDRTIVQRFYLSPDDLRENNITINPYDLGTTKRHAGRDCLVVDATLVIRSQNHPDLKGN